MTYGFHRNLYLENGAVVTAAAAQARRSSAARYSLAWRNLDADRRISLIDGLMKAA